MSYDPTPPLIPLDNAADLDRIQASFHTTLREILASKLAAAGLGGDGEAADPVERKAIEAELDQWESAIFDQAAPNLKLNGLPYTAFLADPALIEPFDEPLDRRLRSLAAEQELIAVQLAERRSATPLAIRGLVADLAERKRVGERTVGGPEGGDAEGAMDGVEEQAPLRLAASKPALEQTFAQTLGQLGQLASNLPAQLERANQAQSVLAELNRLPPSGSSSTIAVTKQS